MCVFRRPKPPKMPETPETAPKAEATASAPTLGSKRKGLTKPDRTSGSTSGVGSGVSTSSPRRGLYARRRGTESLRIPLQAFTRIPLKNIRYS